MRIVLLKTLELLGELAELSLKYVRTYASGVHVPKLVKGLRVSYSETSFGA